MCYLPSLTPQLPLNSSSSVTPFTIIHGVLWKAFGNELSTDCCVKDHVQIGSTSKLVASISLRLLCPISDIPHIRPIASTLWFLHNGPVQSTNLPTSPYPFGQKSSTKFHIDFSRGKKSVNKGIVYGVLLISIAAFCYKILDSRKTWLHSLIINVLKINVDIILIKPFRIIEEINLSRCAFSAEFLLILVRYRPMCHLALLVLPILVKVLFCLWRVSFL